MSGPDTPSLKEPAFALGGISVALFLYYFLGGIVGNLFAVTEDDISAVVYIDYEHDSGYRHGPSFDVTIEGRQVNIPVGYQDAEDYNRGDEIGISYDRHTWKDGSVTVSDIKLRK